MTLQERVLEAVQGKLLPPRMLYSELEDANPIALDFAIRALLKTGALLLSAGCYQRTGDSRSAEVTAKCKRTRRGAQFGGSLTCREEEVAELAQAHTAHEITSLLGISLKTVSGHLTAIYAKLGVRGREELAKRLAERRIARPNITRRTSASIESRSGGQLEFGTSGTRSI